MDNAFVERAPMRLRRPARLLRLAGDERLVALVRAGDEGAFEALYDRHHPAILGFCRHMLGSREEVEDAVQQTFLSAFRDLVATDKPIELRPWLFAIARNRCVSLLRARRAHVAIELAEPATDGLAATVERREDLRELLADLGRLPEDQRAALLLAELGALDHAGIATVLGCPREKVKALVFQARTSLAASREARATPCDEIRLELATASGAELRRGPLRRHLRACDGCRAFKAEVATQRKMFALALPVVPGIALKASVLSGGSGAVASGGGAVGAASATTAGATVGASGGTLGVLGTAAGAGKVAVTLAVAGAVATGGTVVERLAPRAAEPPAASPPALGDAPRLLPAAALESPRSAATGPSDRRQAITPSATSEARPGGATAAPQQAPPAHAPDGHAKDGGAPGGSHVPSHATPAPPVQPAPPQPSGRGGGATRQPPALPPQAQDKGPGSAPPPSSRAPSGGSAAPARPPATPPANGRPEHAGATGRPSTPSGSAERGGQPGASASRRSQPVPPAGNPRFEPAARGGGSASGPPAGKPAPAGPPAGRPSGGPPAGKPAPGGPAPGKPASPAPPTDKPAPAGPAPGKSAPPAPPARHSPPSASQPDGSNGQAGGTQGKPGGARGGSR